MTERPNCLIYCSVSHLFVSGGLYYAAELASRYDVHVLLYRRQASMLRDDERAALERRGVVFHWLESFSRFAKHRYFADLAAQVIADIEPRYILTLDDIDIFACYLGREALRRHVPLVCFQSGAFLAGNGAKQRQQELKYGYAITVDGLCLRGWPLLAAHLFARANPRMRHAFDYWLGPVYAIRRPFPGRSSHYLRVGIECQRYGRLFLVNQPGGREFRIADGMPEDKILSVRHPLMSMAGRAIYSEMYGEPSPTGDILVLVAYSMEPGPDHVAMAARNLSRLLQHLFNSYRGRRILVKLHPTMASDREGALVESLNDINNSNNNVVVVPANINAISLLGRASVLISTPSTALGLMRMFDNRIIACVSFDTPLRAHPLPYPEGVHLFSTVDDLVGVDLLTLEPAPPGSEVPSNAAAGNVDDIIGRYLSKEQGMGANSMPLTTQSNSG